MVYSKSYKVKIQRSKKKTFILISPNLTLHCIRRKVEKCIPKRPVFVMPDLKPVFCPEDVTSQLILEL